MLNDCQPFAPRCPGCGKEMKLYNTDEGYLFMCSCWWASPPRLTLEAAYDAAVKRHSATPALSVTELIEKKKKERALYASLAELAASEICRLQELMETR